MTDVPATADHRLKRLRFRAWRRGFREIDLILGGFADDHGAGMSDEDLVAFEALLEENDQDVYAWIVGQTPVPNKFDTALMTRLRAFRPGAR